MSKEPEENIGLVCAHCLPPAPSDAVICGIEAGSFVQIIRNSERFWLKVTSPQNKRGIVDNDLVMDHPFKCGDEIEFTLDEIIQVLGE